MNEKEFASMFGQQESSVSAQERNDAVTGMAFGVLMRKVYTWMTLALAITAGAAYYVAHSDLIFTIANNPAIMWGLIIGELVLVIALSAAINKLSLSVATIMFVIYSLVNGVTLSFIFLVYDIGTIGTVFLITAATFGAMALLGYTTKKDLSGMGRFLLMALIGIIIATVVNLLFVKSAGFDLLLSYAGVLIFAGLTAYDTQKIKEMCNSFDYADASAQKLALLGALSLYLDFINLFLYLLRIFGRRS
ncbi:MAG: Bax inhibitor-1/YccA family protein [Prevotella sp.]|nr:Bax inhibitor-1/YccA family protein [Prevotella sp.]